MRIAVAAALAAVTVIIGPVVLAAPARIVSMNLCTDQLLMLLADRTQIASVSYLAFDTQSSPMVEQAAGLPRNHGLAEEILPLNPDLVLASTFTTRSTVFLLRRLGYRVVELPVASSLDDIRANIRLVADAVGRPERGEAMVAAFDRELSAATETLAGPAPVAALYWANGLTSGRGTLADAIVRYAGFRNLAGERGLVGMAQLSLETLLASEPQVLVVGGAGDGAALAGETLRHPALRAAFADRPTVAIPDRFWVCGTPFVAEVVRRLVAARRALGGRG